MRKRLRRFEPRFGVSQAAVDIEASALRREVEDYELLSPADVKAQSAERHASCEHSWEHLQMLLAHLPERNQRLVQCLLFRDLFHVLELYRVHLSTGPEPIASAPPARALAAAPLEFSEWLFNLNPGKE